MICSKCNSDSLHQAGTRRGKPALRCNNCGFQTVKNALSVGRPQLEATPACPDCGGKSRKRGSDRKGRQRYECLSCKLEGRLHGKTFIINEIL